MALAARSTKKGYYCNRCEEVYEEDDYESLVVLYSPVVLDGAAAETQHCSMVYVLPDTGTREDAWKCGSDCFHHDEGSAPYIVQLWQCGECQELFVEGSDAAECCQ